MLVVVVIEKSDLIKSGYVKTVCCKAEYEHLKGKTFLLCFSGVALEGKQLTLENCTKVLKQPVLLSPLSLIIILRIRRKLLPLLKGISF